jgi:2,3-bisphosphoglycerate-dependent phosphoglycerate mutase
MKLFFAFAIACLCISCTQTFYVVRHAEKVDNSDDPELSQLGRERAVDLQNYITERLDTVFTSFKKRTILTGLTVALPRSIPQITIDQANEQSLLAFIERLKKISGNKAILIVGHTNTVPKIVLGISGQAIDPIPENDFDNIYIIKRSGNSITLQKLTYGKPSPAN